MDIRAFFCPPLLVGIIYLATLNGVPKYVGQEVQQRFKTPAGQLKYREGRHAKDARHVDEDGNSAPLCPAFGRAILKYGASAFKFETLCVFYARTKPDLQKRADDLERKFIAQYNTMSPNGYNLTSGGQNGYTYTHEARQAISRGCKEAMTDERRREISERNSKLTQLQKDSLVTEYSNGVSASDLATKYGVSITTVTNRLRDQGVDVVWGQGGHYVLGENHPQAKIKSETVRAIYSEKSSVIGAGREAARKFGVTPQTVSKIWRGIQWGSITGAGSS